MNKTVDMFEFARKLRGSHGLSYKIMVELLANGGRMYKDDMCVIVKSSRGNVNRALSGLIVWGLIGERIEGPHGRILLVASEVF